MADEIEVTRAVSFRARCVKCQRTDMGQVPRFGACMVVPVRMVCVICGSTMKVLSPEIKKLLSGAPGVEDL